MAANQFKCPKCTRTFAMKAHLGRHMATTHRTGGRPRAASKKPGLRGRPRGRPRGSGRRAAGTPAAAGALLGGGATQFMQSMRAYHADLAAQRDALTEQISVLESAMTLMGTEPRRKRGRPKGSGGPRRKRGRPKGSGGPRRFAPAAAAGKRGGRAPRRGSLREMVVKVLSQRRTPMSPHEIAASVVKAGYRTKAKDLTKAVSNALPQIKAVKKVGFGSYAI